MAVFNDIDSLPITGDKVTYYETNIDSRGNLVRIHFESGTSLEVYCDKNPYKKPYKDYY